MAEESYREIYLFKKWRVPPIDIVYGSALPITLKFLDYTIPANATIMVYASVDETTVYQQSATASGNAVQFTPGYGFFAVGLNKLQIAINGNKITLEILVNCQRFLAEGNDPTSTPEAVRPLVEEAREILKETQAVAVKTPYVGENGNWYVWDTSTGTFKDSGEPSKGEKGDAFTYADFTAEQLAELKGPKGDAFTYADFTAEQLAGLKGPKGDAFEYSDFTPAQLAALKGDPGTPATVTSTETVYQTGTSGTEAPTGTWSAAVPTVPQGQYLWVRVTTQFNTGSPVVYYSVSRFGVDGSGAVKTVNGKAADEAGEVTLGAADVGARPDTWVPTAADVGAVATNDVLTAEEIEASTDLTGKVAGAEAVKVLRRDALGFAYSEVKIHECFTAKLILRRFGNVVFGTQYGDCENVPGAETDVGVIIPDGFRPGFTYLCGTINDASSQKMQFTFSSSGNVSFYNYSPPSSSPAVCRFNTVWATSDAFPS